MKTLFLHKWFKEIMTLFIIAASLFFFSDKGLAANSIMVDNYNDANQGANTLGYWTGGGGSNGFDLREVYLHKDSWYWNNAKKITYDCSAAGGYGWYTSNLWDGAAYSDISSFNYLSFRARGEAGGEDFYIELQNGGAAPAAEIHSADYFALTTEWRQVNIPLTAFAGLDKTKMQVLVIIFRDNLNVKKGTIYIDNLQFSNGYGKPESAGPVRIDRDTRKLFVNGEPYRIKGVGYQPVPIGGYPPNPDDPEIYDRDFPVLTDMGCNTVRAWGIPGINLLNKAEQYGLKVIGGFWIDLAADCSDPAVRAGIKQNFTAFVNTYKNSPPLLFWALGNENNYHNGSNAAYYSLCNELGQIAYQLEGDSYHPVIIVNGHIFNIGVEGKNAEDLQLNYIDAWGSNIYLEHFDNIVWEGDANRNFFNVYKEKTFKPIVITEYGADAYFTTDRWSLAGYVDEDMQASWVEQNTREIMAAMDVCLGSTLMAYSDEWWKAGGQSPWIHDPGGFYQGDFGHISPDDYANEEYWGVVQIATDGTWDDGSDGLDDIKKRKVFYILKALFNDGWALNMTEMDWFSNAAPYNSTAAAVCRMILNYIREGAGASFLTLDEIYQYGRAPLTYDGTELTADEVDKVLGHFDPYDLSVSNWADIYDSLPGGNPYQGYNYSVDAYPLNEMNNYVRDISHWMAYTVTKEDWWKDGELVARPNTPAAIPIFGDSESYGHWVAVKGCVTSANPAPAPHVNPWNTPDFIVYGFWMKDPKTDGIGQNTYKTTAECISTYFKPLSTVDEYNGMLLLVAEPPPVRISSAHAEIPVPKYNPANLEFIGVDPAVNRSGASNVLAMAFHGTPSDGACSIAMKQKWSDLVDAHLLTDAEAVAAFEGTDMGKPVFVERADISPDADYYLVPFGKDINGVFLASGVIILDAADGYFKEASWTDKPEAFMKINRNKALNLAKQSLLKDLLKTLRQLPKRPVKRYLSRINELLRRYSKLARMIKYAKATLIWEPGGYSPSPYKPYWEVDIDGLIRYVTQDGRVKSSL